MKSKLIKTIVLTLLLCMLLPTLSFAEGRSTEANINVIQNFTVENGKKPSAGYAFQYIMRPVEEGNPMPSDTDADGCCRFSISGQGKNSAVLTLSFDDAGLYNYVIETDIPRINANYYYDKSTYEIAVHVKNTDDGGLEPTIVIRRGDEKCTAVSYNHSYRVETRPRTADDSGSGLWLGIMIFSAAGACLIPVIKKRSE